MINTDLMNKLNELGFGSDVDALESYVARLQDSAGMGEPEVEDAVYDMYRKLLSEVKPDSEILNRNWEVDDNDYSDNDGILKAYGMKSITTIKDMSELKYFKDLLKTYGSVNMLASTKLNGHATRAVYKYGELVSGSTRGRSKKGRDITRTLKKRLPNHVAKWESYPLVEVRGEALVSFDNFDKVKHILKTPLSSVTSFIKDSASDEEISLLDFVCYKVIIGEDLDEIKFNSLEAEYKELEECGFNIPRYKVFTDINFNNFESKINEIIEYFEELNVSGEVIYDTDGIVVSVNDDNLFYGMGANGNHWLGNFALKMGTKWGVKVYTSVIQDIEWVRGKTYITPKALINPVKTSNGAEVHVVPLYNVGVMNRLHLIPGETVFFLFGGETGVSLCDKHGNKVTDMQ